MLLILARDRVKLRVPQPLAERPGGEPGGLVPAGAIGEVINVGVTGANVRWRGKYPPIPVNLRDLEHASLVDLMPVAVQRVGGWIRAGVRAGIGKAASTAIVAVVSVLITLWVQRWLGKC